MQQGEGKERGRGEEREEARRKEEKQTSRGIKRLQAFFLLSEGMQRIEPMDM